MTQLLKYKGYQGTVEPDLESNILCGKVLFIRSLLVYEANTLPELRERFKQLIDEYLEDCKAEGIEPDKPCSGTFNIRISPETHRQLTILSIRNGRCLNEEVKVALEEHVSNHVKDERYPLEKIAHIDGDVSLADERCEVFTPYFTKVGEEVKEC